MCSFHIQTKAGLNDVGGQCLTCYTFYLYGLGAYVASVDFVQQFFVN